MKLIGRFIGWIIFILPLCIMAGLMDGVLEALDSFNAFVRKIE